MRGEDPPVRPVLRGMMGTGRDWAVEAISAHLRSAWLWYALALALVGLVLAIEARPFAIEP